MEDTIRDAVISVGHPIYYIGGPIVVAAIFGWLAWKAKDEYKFLAGLCVAVAIGAIIVAASVLPIAQAACKADFQRGGSLGAYDSHHCYLITSCHKWATEVTC